MVSDGSAIVTKALQMDGTTKMVIYKPTIENEAVSQSQVNNITIDDINNCMQKFDKFDELKKEIEELRNALKIEKSKK